MGSNNKVRKSKRKKIQEVYEENLIESDDTFAFIAGYTSGGVPYGITWEEMEEIERRDKEFLGEKYQDDNIKEFDLPFD